MGRCGYVQVVNDFWRNRKVQKLRGLCPGALGAFMLALTYCGDELTDGFIDEDSMRWVLRVSDEETRALVDAGMLEETDGGYVIHDYLRHNRSRDQVMRKRDANAADYQRRRKNSTTNGVRNVESGSEADEQLETSDSNMKQPVESHIASEKTCEKKVSDDIQTSECNLNRDKHQNTRTPEHISSSPYPSSPEEPDAKTAREEDGFFTTAWEAYPKHTGGRQAARRAWDETVAANATPETLTAAAMDMAEQVRSGRREYRYTPTMARWLRDSQWKDHRPANAGEEPHEHCASCPHVRRIAAASNLIADDETTRARLARLLNDGAKPADAVLDIRENP